MERTLRACMFPSLTLLRTVITRTMPPFSFPSSLVCFEYCVQTWPKKSKMWIQRNVQPNLWPPEAYNSSATILINYKFPFKVLLMPFTALNPFPPFCYSLYRQERTSPSFPKSWNIWLGVPFLFTRSTAASLQTVSHKLRCSVCSGWKCVTGLSFPCHWSRKRLGHPCAQCAGRYPLIHFLFAYHNRPHLIQMGSPVSPAFRPPTSFSTLTLSRL